MIYGDPFVFSIQFDVVREWTESDGFWLNGVFCMFVDGRRILESLEVVELKVAVNFYANMEFDSLLNGDPEVSAAEVFKSAHGYFFEGRQSCVQGVQDMTCTFIGDAGLFVYFQKCEVVDRLIWSYDFGSNVHEKLFPVGTIIDVVSSVEEL